MGTRKFLLLANDRLGNGFREVEPGKVFTLAEAMEEIASRDASCRMLGAPLQEFHLGLVTPVPVHPDLQLMSYPDAEWRVVELIMGSELRGKGGVGLDH